MATVAETLLSELEESVSDLIQHFGDHEGSCTNIYQKAEQKPVPPCTRHLDALKRRKERVASALEQFKLLRDVFSGGPNEYSREEAPSRF